jgi:hypothetical protein
MSMSIRLERVSAVGQILFLLGVIVVLGGCATSGPTYSEAIARTDRPDANHARLYVYRATALGFAVQPEVKVNGVVVGRAVPNGYFYVDEPPGAYEVTATTEVERKLSLMLDKGQVRYVRLGVSMGFFVGHVYPELVDEDVAQREIRNLRLTGGS